MSGFIPRVRILTEPGLLYTAIGILGATVMPHNLFLHSAIVQTRNYPRTAAGEDRCPNHPSIPTVTRKSSADARWTVQILTSGPASGTSPTLTAL